LETAIFQAITWNIQWIGLRKYLDDLKIPPGNKLEKLTGGYAFIGKTELPAL